MLSNKVLCCQLCDVIGQDFELPVQITASPVQSLPSVRSLEEELQEAIQKAQVGVCRREGNYQDILSFGGNLTFGFTSGHRWILVSP